MNDDRNNRPLTAEQQIDWLTRDNRPQLRAAALLILGECQPNHHRRWYVTQALKTLAGPAYQKLTQLFQELNGEPWDEGIAP